MHSGRLVIANHSAVSLKGVLFPSSKAIKSILNYGGENIGTGLSNRGKAGRDEKILTGPRWMVFGERNIFHEHIS